jgi:hypothetical protein
LLTPANYWLGFASLPWCDPVAHRADSAVQVAAAVGIIDAIAVADIEAALAAVLPDRVLDEPGEGPRKGRVELPGAFWPCHRTNIGSVIARCLGARRTEGNGGVLRELRFKCPIVVIADKREGTV